MSFEPRRLLSPLTLLLCLTACGDDDVAFDGGAADGGTLDSSTDASDSSTGPDVADDPCVDVPADERCTETLCEGATLVVCEANSEGCLVRRATDCAASGLECSVGAMGPSCVASTCTHECDAVGLSCERYAVLTCSEDASGCRRLERAVCGLGCTEEPTPMCLGNQPDECGNSIVEGLEACDDGNTMPGDGCSSGCSVEDGYLCPGGTDCRLSCGDGEVNGEDECDDGGTADGDGCSASCTVEAGFFCQGDSPTRCSVLLGGDAGILENSDDPWTRPEESCTASATATVFDAFPYTNATSNTQQLTVAAEFAFDGYLFVFDAAPDGASPLSGCRVGDDDLGDDTSEARLNGVVVPPGETIFIVISSFRGGRGTYSFSLYDDAFTCGDSAVDFSLDERCDDGGREDGDGCSGACRVEDSYVCSGEPSVCRLAVCGDGVVEGDEACDDGDLVMDDGCTLCEQDDGYFCFGQPSVCVPQVCGNSIVEAGEVCDDGNTDGADGCEADCFSAVFTGSLTPASPLWARPDENCVGSSADHHYEVLAFEWQGAADTELVWTVNWGGVDGYLHVYDEFNVSMPLDGCLVGDDDAPRPSRSQVRQSIMSGETQEAVLSTYTAGDTGNWMLTISR